LRQSLFEAHPHFADMDMIKPAKWVGFGGRGKVGTSPIGAALDNFHMTCAISRASETMAECRRAAAEDSAAVAAE
jgi:NADH-quinone oxidoreductase subunit G